MKNTAFKWVLYILFFTLGVAAKDTNNAMLKASVNSEAKETVIEQTNNFIATGYEPKITIFNDFESYYNYDDFHYSVDVVKTPEELEANPLQEAPIIKHFRNAKVIENDTFFAEIDLDEIEVNGFDMSIEYVNSKEIKLDVVNQVSIPERLNLG